MKIALTIVAALLTISSTQELAFPGLEDGEAPGKQPPRLSENRVPLYIPGRCPPNQLLYPGDQKHDWICDCGPGFIYHPTKPKDGCYPAYRQGPCAAKEYLMLPVNKVIPECVDNPCQTDGFVQFNGKCYELDKSGGPCKAANEGGGVFGVNATTLALECLQGPDRLSLIKFPPNCPPGSRRGANHCRLEYRRK